MAGSVAFGDVLRRWRTGAGLGQGELAAMAGCSQRHLSFVENGKSKASADLVVKIAHALRMQPNDGNELLRLAGYSATFFTPEPQADNIGVMMRFAATVLDGVSPSIATIADDHARVLMMNRMAAELFGQVAEFEEVWEDGFINFFYAALHPRGMRAQALDWPVMAEALVQALVRSSWRNPDLYDQILRRIYLYPGMRSEWRRPISDASPPPLVPLTFRLRGRMIRVQMPTVMLSPPAPTPNAIFPDMRLTIALATDEATRDALRALAADIAGIPPHKRLAPFVAHSDFAKAATVNEKSI